VEPGHLVPLIEGELVRPPATVDAYLIDEIGKMECHCTPFITSMSALLGGPIPVLATIALRCGGFIAQVKKRPDVQVVEVTPANRHDLPGRIAAWIKQRTSRANTL
jgi:nucleoside-triphosphatase